MSDSATTTTAALSPQFIILMATACGLCAGSAYLNQPLIYSIEKSIGISTSQAGFAVVVAIITGFTQFLKYKRTDKRKFFISNGTQS